MIKHVCVLHINSREYESMHVCFYTPFIAAYIRSFIAHNASLSLSTHDMDPDIQQLLSSLEKLSPRLQGREEDLSFLKKMLQSNEFHSLMKVGK